MNIIDIVQCSSIISSSVVIRKLSACQKAWSSFKILKTFFVVSGRICIYHRVFNHQGILQFVPVGTACKSGVSCLLQESTEPKALLGSSPRTYIIIDVPWSLFCRLSSLLMEDGGVGGTVIDYRQN